jgi:hypothetical protein
MIYSWNLTAHNLFLARLLVVIAPYKYRLRFFIIKISKVKKINIFGNAFCNYVINSSADGPRS